MFGPVRPLNLLDARESFVVFHSPWESSLISVVMFLAYSVFCFWVIFLEGAEVLEGWGAFALMGWFAATLTPRELKFYVGISWIAGLVVALIALFSGGSGD
jgi:hypothetical protein